MSSLKLCSPEWKLKRDRSLEGHSDRHSTGIRLASDWYLDRHPETIEPTRSSTGILKVSSSERHPGFTAIKIVEACALNLVALLTVLPAAGSQLHKSAVVKST